MEQASGSAAPRRRRPAVRALLLVGAVTAGALLAACLGDATGARAAPAPGASSTTALPADAGYPALERPGAPTWADGPHVLLTDLGALPGDEPHDPCTVDAQAVRSAVCWLGDPRGASTLALVGDSHAFQWLSALDSLAREHHWRLVSILHNSCPFDLVPRLLETRGDSRCTTAVRAALPVLAASHARVVLTSAYRPGYEGRESAGAAGYESMWARLEHGGMAVVVLGDTPRPMQSPLTGECAATGDPDRCGVPRRAAEAVVDTLATAAKRSRTPFLDPVQAFCRPAWCPGVIGGLVVYRDGNHVADSYARTVAPWLEQRLVPLVDAALRHGPRHSR